MGRPRFGARHAYPAQLKTILQAALHGVDAEIVNHGVSGEVAEASAERLRTEVALQRPDLVLWQVGTNDALSRVAPDDFERTVRDTVEWLKSDGIDAVLVGLQYTPPSARNASYSAIRDALQRVAASENVLYIRRDDAMAFIAQHYGNADASADDSLNLGDLGNPCHAEHVAHAVIANLSCTAGISRKTNRRARRRTEESIGPESGNRFRDQSDATIKSAERRRRFHLINRCVGAAPKTRARPCAPQRPSPPAR